MVQHIGIGILTFKKSGQVQLMNNAAKRLLQVPRLEHAEHLHTISPQLTEQPLTLPAGQSAVLKLPYGKERVPVSLYLVDLVLWGEDLRVVSPNESGVFLRRASKGTGRNAYDKASKRVSRKAFLACFS